MIKRLRCNREFKESILIVMLSGISKAAVITNREVIGVVTLSKWKEEIASGQFKDTNKVSTKHLSLLLS